MFPDATSFTNFSDTPRWKRSLPQCSAIIRALSTDRTLDFKYVLFSPYGQELTHFSSYFPIAPTTLLYTQQADSQQIHAK